MGAASASLQENHSLCLLNKFWAPSCPSAEWPPKAVPTVVSVECRHRTLIRCLFSLSLSLGAVVLQSPWDQPLQWEFTGGQYLTLLSYPDFSCLCYTLFINQFIRHPCCPRDALILPPNFLSSLLSSFLFLPLPFAFHIGFLSAKIDPLTFSISWPFSSFIMMGTAPWTNYMSDDREWSEVWAVLCVPVCACPPV